MKRRTKKEKEEIRIITDSYTKENKKNKEYQKKIREWRKKKGLDF